MFVAWLLTFSIGYDRVFPRSFLDKWDAREIALDNYWVF